jgi:hypothetical protein
MILSQVVVKTTYGINNMLSDAISKFDDMIILKSIDNIISLKA